MRLGGSFGCCFTTTSTAAAVTVLLLLSSCCSCEAFLLNRQNAYHDCIQPNIITNRNYCYYDYDYNYNYYHSSTRISATTKSNQEITETITETATTITTRVGDLLSDLPTPSLLLELSLAENAIKKENKPELSLDKLLLEIDDDDDVASLLEGTLFIHTKVIDTSKRDAVTQDSGSGKSQIICKLDATTTNQGGCNSSSPTTTIGSMIPGGAYLGIGLANHLVGGYYWARGMGMGASLPAHGISFDDTTSELYWKKRGPGQNAKETTEESSNSNDGKRSEWADFVSVGDTVQLVPNDVLQVLSKKTKKEEEENSLLFTVLLGVRRIGRPLGADPIVEKIWIRSNDNGEGGGGGWKVYS